jgi:hypothetical protein
MCGEEHCILTENWKIGNKSNVHVLISDVEIHGFVDYESITFHDISIF